MRCLIVGAGGFIGRHLLEALLLRGDNVISVGRRSSGPAVPRSVRTVVADITEPRVADELVRDCRPEAVVNLSGATAGTAEQLCLANIWGPLALLTAVAKHEPQARVVLTGSAAEYGAAGSNQPLLETTPCRPIGLYGSTKLAGTLATLRLAGELNLAVSVIRPFNVVGAGVPRSLVVGALIERIVQAGENGAVRVGRVDTQRDFVAVEDVVAAIVGLLGVRPRPDVYNVCSAVPVTLKELQQQLVKVCGHPVRFVTDPELVRPADVAIAYGSYSHLNALTGFKPTVPLERSLAQAWSAAAAASAPVSA